VVPKAHPLAQLNRAVSLHDIAAYPIVSYASSTRADSGLRHAFDSEQLTLNLAFTARDADIIKTYVKTGLGVGIIAGMAFDAEQDHDLVALNSDGLFPKVKTWVGLRIDTVLRKHTLNFILRFAPQLNERDILAALGTEDFKTVMYYI
jgi:DNA-binding transcriptional LysR family regulator